MSTRTLAILAITIASIFWATSGVANKTLLATLSPFQLVFFRTTLASIFLLPFLVGKQMPSLKAIFFDIVPIALFSTGNFLLFSFGLQRTTANAQAILYTATPILTLIISRFILKESSSKQKVGGIVLALIGVLYILVSSAVARQTLAFGTLSGNLITMCAVLSWSLYIIGSRHLTATKHYSPLMLTAIGFMTASVVSGIAVLTTGQSLSLTPLSRMPVIGLLLYLSLCVTITPYVLQQWAIKHSSATTGSLTNYIQPTLGIAFNSLLLKEPLTPGFLVGFVIVFAGVLMTTGITPKTLKKLLSR